MAAKSKMAAELGSEWLLKIDFVGLDAPTHKYKCTNIIWITYLYLWCEFKMAAITKMAAKSKMAATRYPMLHVLDNQLSDFKV